MALTLYRIPQVLFLTLSNTGESLMNYPTYRTNFKLFKNVTNDVDLFVKDQDRKAVSLIGKSLKISIVDDRVPAVVLVRDLAIIDPYRGLARLTTAPSDTANLDSGFLSFTVSFFRDDGSEVLLYTDQNYGPKSVVEIVDGPLPPPVPARQILPVDFTTVSSGLPLLTYSVTSPLVGAAQIGDTSGVHSAALYKTNFTGKFWIQASLENQVPTLDIDWFNVPIGLSDDFAQFSASTGVVNYSFTGNFMWVRFRYYVDVMNLGTVDQILYRN